MNKREIRKILVTLYELDPELARHEVELMKLIVRMKAQRPETNFDKAFAAELKAELLGRPVISKGIINLNFMNKKIFVAVGSAALVGVLLFVFWRLDSGQPQETVSLARLSSSEEGVHNLAAGAFGSLAGINNQVSAPAGAGGENLAVAKPLAAGESNAASFTAERSAISADSKMILPYYGFKYEYRGDPLDLSATEAPVYRRLKGDRQAARDLAASFLGASAGFDLGTLSNLKVSTVSLLEDKDLGLAVNLDFNEDTISIYENWQKWSLPERDTCGDNQVCWERFRLKFEDYPADSDLVAITDAFLEKHNVDRAHYGAGLPDNSWKISYEAASDKSGYYIPEYASVVYPLLVDGQPVKTTGGTFAGLQVTVNLLQKAVSGLYGLTPYRYESSNYELETEEASIINLAENGGWGTGYYGNPENIQTIGLGTPEKVYVQLYRYRDNSSEELLVPALVFPVIDIPDSASYFGSRSLVVPLVKEILQEANNQPTPLYRTMIEPAMTIEASPASSAPASEPEIAPGLEIMTR